MTTSLKISSIVACFFLVSLSSFYAQETAEQYKQRKEAMLREEAKIEMYITDHLHLSLPEEVLKQFETAIHNAEHQEHNHHHALTEEEEKEMFDNFKRSYWRTQYFIKNPSAQETYIAKSAPVCYNGSFETGNFSGYSGFSSSSFADGYSGGNCAINSGSFTLTPTPLATANPLDFDIMGVGADPYVVTSSLNRVATGNFSARINSDAGTNSPNRGVNRLTKDIVLTQDNQAISFKYALVMVDPTGHPNTKPTFKARLLNSAGNECDWICTEADIADPFLNLSGSMDGSDPIVYKDWDCASLQACGLAGETVTLEFTMTDCGLGAHWGYAYIDDICDTCVIDPCNFSGNIDLEPTDTCVLNNTMTVCGTYNLSAIDCDNATVDEIRLYIYQNGVQVGAGPIAIDTNPTGGTFCFTVSPSDFPSGATGGFDFYAEVDFAFGTNVTTQNDFGSNPGLNNDFIFDPLCCENVTEFWCNTDNGHVLGWTAIPGAIYQIEIIYNDPICIKGGTPSNTVMYTTSANTFTVPVTPTSGCLSWRVRTICANDVESAWSEKMCCCKPVSSCIPPVPNNLGCSMLNGGQMLSWSSAGAAGITYEIGITWNDPICCTNNQPSTSQIVTSTNPYYFVNSLSGTCFSWRVRSVCPDGSRSAWSTFKCSCYCQHKKNQQSGVNDPSLTDYVMNVATVPNPAQDFITFEVSTENTTRELGSLRITSLTGEVVLRTQIKLNGKTKVDLTDLAKGTYIYQVVSESAIQSGSIVITD